MRRVPLQRRMACAQRRSAPAASKPYQAPAAPHSACVPAVIGACRQRLRCGASSWTWVHAGHCAASNGQHAHHAAAWSQGMCLLWNACFGMLRVSERRGSKSMIHRDLGGTGERPRLDYLLVCSYFTPNLGSQTSRECAPALSYTKLQIGLSRGVQLPQVESLR